MEEVQSYNLEPTPILMAAGGAMLVGSLIAVIAWIILVVKGFNTNVGWGLVVLLLSPLGALIYGLVNWARGGGAFLAYLIANILVVAGFVMVYSDPQVKQMIEEAEAEATSTSAQVELPGFRLGDRFERYL